MGMEAMNRRQRRRWFKAAPREASLLHTVRMACGHLRRFRGAKPRAFLHCLDCDCTRSIVKIKSLRAPG
jgi:hypothetical protein